MTGCGKNKKIRRVEDPMITAPGFHVGWLCLHRQACSLRAQVQLVLGLTPPRQ